MTPKVSLAPDAAWEPAKRRAGTHRWRPVDRVHRRHPRRTTQRRLKHHQFCLQISTITALTGSAQHVWAATGPGRKMAAGLPEPGRLREARPTVIPGNRLARCLDVEVASQGRTIDEALANLREALELYFEDEPAPNTPEPLVAPVEIRLSA
jgi:hypothetical protein